MNKPIVHFGMARIDRKECPCGARADWESDRIKPEEVTCIKCCKKLSKAFIKTSRTPKWLKRYEELKEAQENGH